MKKIKKGFTLIELIVVMAIIAILVLIASPKFMGYTEKAKMTQVINDIKASEKAAELYYMENDGWPRDQLATPYTAAQLNTWVSEFKTLSGETAVLDTGAKYYDVDWDKLKGFMDKPDNGFKYIIQNPIGDIFYAYTITEAGQSTKFAGEVATTEPTTEEVTNPPVIEVESLNITAPNANTNVNIGSSLQLSADILPVDATNKSVTWSINDSTIATIDSSGLVTPIKVGNATVTATVGSITKTMNISVTNLTTSGRYMIIDVYDYHVYSNMYNNSAVIVELDVLDTLGAQIPYTIVSAYDSAVSGQPMYWNDSWGKHNMNDNSLSTADGAATLLMYNFPYTQPNQGKWARILIDLQSTKTISEVVAHLGSPYGRTPQKLTFYLTDSYTAGSLSIRDENIQKFGEIIVPSVKTSLTRFSTK